MTTLLPQAKRQSVREREKEEISNLLVQYKACINENPHVLALAAKAAGTGIYRRI